MINARLSKLRKYMLNNNIDVCLIPTNDPHSSEYIAPYWEIRKWLTGFTGSAGTAVVTHNEAGLWTDSRYFLQAEKELKETGFKLHKVMDRTQPSTIQWIIENSPSGTKVAIVSELISENQRKLFEGKLVQAGMNLLLVDDFFSKIWDDRPKLPNQPIFEVPLKYSGEKTISKIDKIRHTMSSSDCQYFLTSTLDEIAWVLNLRGSDIEFNPVFLSYLSIGKDDATLFVDKSKLDTHLIQHLNESGIGIQDYFSVHAYLESLDPDNTILVDKSHLNAHLYKTIPCHIESNRSPIQILKANKNETEANSMKSCHIKDGVALVKAFVWLERNILNENISEFDFAQKIAECRSEQDEYFSESFPAIVGYGPNGAIVHYRPDKVDALVIRNEGILLVDSGGQYLDGTTDITRTVALGTPTKEQKRAYTLVLKGHIQLDKAIFPKGTTGVQLDTLARQYLWSGGLNFLHGTGHGIGHFLNVHEGPQSISPRSTPYSSTSFQVGMITSNEPGYYQTGEYGIRIENVILCKKSDIEDFLCFETISLFPIDTSLINLEMLTKEEQSWLNQYHSTVFDSLKGHLDEEHRNWLQKKCLPL